VKRYLRTLALVGVLSVVGAACGGAGGGGGGGGGTPGAELQQGGTLNLAIAADVDKAFDPAKEYSALAWEMFRCCLLRTLVSYPGVEADQGGNELQPDLVAEMPTVSEDGLTYTFALKEGLTYAPPYDDVPITAADFVRAIEREACDVCSSEGYSFYYGVIEGFEEADGSAGSVSGATAVDDQTLEITLTQPAGDFLFLMAMPAMAPIPEGAADGHEEDYGRFLAQSGPYMFEGSEQIAEGTEAPGYDPGRSWTLVRNPSWDQDELRKAYVDEIVVEINENVDVSYEKFQEGEIHMVFDGVPPPQVLREFSTNPDLQDQLHVNPSDGVRYISMNIAEPPFDDIHVRKALNLVLDKDALRLARGGELFGDLAGHTIPNTLLRTSDGTFVLQDYDPYPSPNGQGDLEAAQEEMRQSKYDSNQDGVCDDPVCENILLVADREDPYPEQNAIIADGGDQIGLTFDIREGDRYTFMYDTCDDTGSHFGLCPSTGWFKDYPDAASFGYPLFHSDGIGSSNYSLVGADSQLLQKEDYPVDQVPTADEKIEECLSLPIGDERITCWAEADQMIMEDIVPWVPFLFDNDVDLQGDALQNYVYDSSAGLMALDQVAVSGGETAA
jgi:ABC-type oligopeptide transport system substrate-binding subunit